MDKQLQDTAKMDNSYLVQTVSWQGDQNLLIKTCINAWFGIFLVVIKFLELQVQEYSARVREV